MIDVREVAVLGGGAWGTALAVHLARHSHARPRVTLYIRSEEQMRDCRATLTNRRYLPDVRLPESIALTSSLGDVGGADILFAATPVAELIPLAAALASAGVAAPLVSLAKGLIASGDGWSLPHRALAATWPRPVGTATREALDAWLPQLAAIGAKCSAAGLTFAYHNHWWDLVPLGGEAPLDVMARTIAPQDLSFEVDLAWCWFAGVAPLDLIARLGQGG